MGVKRLTSVPFELAGASLAFGITGQAFDSKGLEAASETTSGFIAPAVNISVGGHLINQLRDINK